MVVVMMDVESTVDLLSKRHCYMLLANLCWSGDMRFNELKSELKCTPKQLSLLLNLLEKNGLVIPFFNKSMNAYFYVATKRAYRLMDVVKKIDGV
jgi:DNA-binding HxlR family transcriptional regulator